MTEDDYKASFFFPKIKKYKFGSDEFRRYFRTDFINHDSGFEFMRMKNGYLYACICLTPILMIILYLAASISIYHPYFIGLIPIYFLVANLAEYLIHRYPMHHKYGKYNAIYAHMTIHHNFYNNEHFYYETHKDFMAVLLPWYTFLVLSLIISVVSTMIYAATGLDNALFFALCMYGYYLLYEGLHFTYHARPESWIKKIPMIDYLSRSHLRHHRYDIMSKYNFNITFPVFDKIFGTYYS
jgi:sterol desaturase/sphingolipid hydroxylase (fatty acid hydroxylase superfamily)